MNPKSGNPYSRASVYLFDGTVYIRASGVGSCPVGLSYLASQKGREKGTQGDSWATEAMQVSSILEPITLKQCIKRIHKETGMKFKILDPSDPADWRHIPTARQLKDSDAEFGVTWKLYDGVEINGHLDCLLQLVEAPVNCEWKLGQVFIGEVKTLGEALWKEAMKYMHTPANDIKNLLIRQYKWQGGSYYFGAESALPVIFLYGWKVPIDDPDSDIAFKVKRTKYEFVNPQDFPRKADYYNRVEMLEQSVRTGRPISMECTEENFFCDTKFLHNYDAPKKRTVPNGDLDALELEKLEAIAFRVLTLQDECKVRDDEMRLLKAEAKEIVTKLPDNKAVGEGWTIRYVDHPMPERKFPAYQQQYVTVQRPRKSKAEGEDLELGESDKQSNDGKPAKIVWQKLPGT